MNKKSSIYTRGGDQGETSLIGGKRISKADERVDLYGELDELNSFIGVLIAELSKTTSDKTVFLTDIQRNIFQLQSLMACHSQDRDRYHLTDINDHVIISLEKEIDLLDEKIPPLKKFILPTGHPTATYCHVCRTITRRIERKLVAFFKTNPKEVSPNMICLINRLSDYFFVMARWMNYTNNIKEIAWET